MEGGGRRRKEEEGGGRRRKEDSGYEMGFICCHKEFAFHQLIDD